LDEQSVPPVQWRAAPTSELHFAQWGDDVVLFHAGSGLTHLINVATAVLLIEVLESPRTLYAAAEALAAAQSAHFDERFLFKVGELLARLETLGLVERITA
jgi:PqqD family protein of HPr-rel-A system